MRIEALLVGIFVCIACGGGGASGDRPTGSTSGGELTERPAAGHPVELGPDGMPINCAIRVGDTCFTSDERDAACAAANCPRESCELLESDPAQIGCSAPTTTP